MLQLQKPKALQEGDKVAILSPSSGMAGDAAFLFRYNIGKQRLENQFGLQVVEYPTTLAGSDYVYAHPEERARDLMTAFADPTIKAIFTTIGGSESIRLLPYIDFDVLQNNPKIFMGYSDNTVFHFMCMKAGISSIYGPTILAEFAENIEIFPYTAESILRTLFNIEPIGKIKPATHFTRELILWTPENQNTPKPVKPNSAPTVLQGKGKVQGRLVGGCMEVIEFMRGTPLFPPISDFENAILFLETSEEMPSADTVARWLRSYYFMEDDKESACNGGILGRINGIVFGKPYADELDAPYMETIQKVLAEELNLPNLPVLFGLNFGHTEPMLCLPYGALAEINCENGAFTILESAVE